MAASPARSACSAQLALDHESRGVSSQNGHRLKVDASSINVLQCRCTRLSRSVCDSPGTVSRRLCRQATIGNVPALSTPVSDSAFRNPAQHSVALHNHREWYAYTNTLRKPLFYSIIDWVDHWRGCDTGRMVSQCPRLSNPDNFFARNWNGRYRNAF